MTSTTSIAALPNVPSFKEQGIDAEIAGWYGFVVPAATPAD
ncbi:hypothetical protein ACOTJH_28335 [Achromobacter xylosoxidans]